MLDSLPFKLLPFGSFSCRTAADSELLHAFFATTCGEEKKRDYILYCCRYCCWCCWFGDYKECWEVAVAAPSKERKWPGAGRQRDAGMARCNDTVIFSTRYKMACIYMAHTKNIYIYNVLYSDGTSWRTNGSVRLGLMYHCWPIQHQKNVFLIQKRYVFVGE